MLSTSRSKSGSGIVNASRVCSALCLWWAGDSSPSGMTSCAPTVEGRSETTTTAAQSSNCCRKAIEGKIDLDLDFCSHEWNDE